MPNSVTVLLIATCLKDVAQGFLFIPVLPEVIDAIYQKRELIEGDDDLLDAVLNDKAAALYGLSYAVGAIIAPLAGSYVYEWTHSGWRLTCDYFAIACAVYTIIFIVINVLPDIHKERQ
jgi:MFS family permease